MLGPAESHRSKPKNGLIDLKLLSKPWTPTLIAVHWREKAPKPRGNSENTFLANGQTSTARFSWLMIRRFVFCEFDARKGDS